MWKIRLTAIFLLIVSLGIGYFNYASETGQRFLGFPFKLGLDLSGGTHLVYRADTSLVKTGNIADAMESLRGVVERRVNIFGVSEPLVQVERSSAVSGVSENRLIVELPGVADVGEAVALIGKTPLLEFRLLKESADAETLALTDFANTPEAADDFFEITGLTGQYVSGAQLNFDQTTREPLVNLQFDAEGSKLFEDLTEKNINRTLAIFLDGVPISLPVIREKIPNGQAQISGGFTPQEAKELVRDLNYGALPVPIELISSEKVGASLGERAVDASVAAGIWGIALISLFLLLWYRLPGLIAVCALGTYTILMLALFKTIPVTLTAAGLAGFILSIGMAVDANILIFERTKEELEKGKILADAIREGFTRAWASIRDSNLSSMITAVILFWLGGTAVIKGFALVFGIGVLVSMFTAITVSRTFLLALGFGRGNITSFIRFLFGNGLNK